MYFTPPPPPVTILTRTATGDADGGVRSAGGVGFRLQPGEENRGLGTDVPPLSSYFFPSPRGDLGVAPRLQCCCKRELTPLEPPKSLPILTSICNKKVPRCEGVTVHADVLLRWGVCFWFVAC